MITELLRVEGPEGIGIFLPETADENETLLIVNDKEKPMRLGDYWLSPGDEVTISFTHGYWRKV